MKRIVKMMLLCAAVCCPLGVQGAPAPWAADGNMQEQQHGKRPLEEIRELPGVHMMYSLMPFVIKGEEIRIAVDISPLGPQHAAEQQNYEKKVKKHFQQWLKNPLFWITSEKREQEFKDLIPTLEGGLKIRFVPMREGLSREEAELRFVIYPTVEEFQRQEEEDSTCVGLFRPGGSYQPMDIFVTVEDESDWVHEIGHAFGLVDEYDDEINEKDGSGVYRSKKRSVYTAMDSYGKTENPLEPTCEDAEGFINIADAWNVLLAKDTPRQSGGWINSVSDRIKRGWKSFECGLDDYYLLGASVHTLFENREKLSPQEVTLVKEALRRGREKGVELTPQEEKFLGEDIEQKVRNAFQKH